LCSLPSSLSVSSRSVSDVPPSPCSRSSLQSLPGALLESPSPFWGASSMGSGGGVPSSPLPPRQQLVPFSGGWWVLPSSLDGSSPVLCVCPLRWVRRAGSVPWDVRSGGWASVPGPPCPRGTAGEWWGWLLWIGVWSYLCQGDGAGTEESTDLLGRGLGALSGDALPWEVAIISDAARPGCPRSEHRRYKPAAKLLAARAETCFRCSEGTDGRAEAGCCFDPASRFSALPSPRHLSQLSSQKC